MTTTGHTTTLPILPGNPNQPIWLLTREMIEDRAGRPCTDQELATVAAYIAFSSITDMLDTIVDQDCGLHPEVTPAMVRTMAEMQASGAGLVLSRDSEDRLRIEPGTAADAAGRDIITDAADVAGWPAVPDLDENACKRIAADLNGRIEDLDASRGGGAVVTAAMVLDLVDADYTPDLAVISRDDDGALRVEPGNQAHASGRQVIADANLAYSWNGSEPLMTEPDAGRYAAVLNDQLSRAGQEGTTGRPQETGVAGTAIRTSPETVNAANGTPGAKR